MDKRVNQPEERIPDPRFLAGWAFHPVVLAAVFVIQPAVSNGLGPVSFARAILVAIIGAAAVLGFFWLLFRNQPVAGLFTTGLLLLLTSHDIVIELLTAARDAWGTWGAMIAIWAAVFVPLAATALGLDQVRRGHLGHRVMKPLTTGLNIFSVVLLVVVSTPALPSVPRWLVSPSIAMEPGDANGDVRPPDIYLFLLDGYSRADELERQFGIDNSPFVSQLQSRGFHVDGASRTNYTYTALTLTSMLSMEYIPVHASGIVPELELREQLHDAVVEGVAVTALRRAGYELVATASAWEHVSMQPGVDRYLDRGELNDFERTLMARTWLPDLPPIPRDLFFDHLRTRIIGVLGDAAEVAAEDRQMPTFTFVHVPSPHLPLAFEDDGQATPYDSRQYLAGRASEFGLTQDAYADAYAANLAYLNARVLDTVDELKAASAEEPIIIIMSDHGYNGDSPILTAAMLHSFFAAYAPGELDALVESPTPVNLMGILLSAYAGADVGQQLPERFFTTVVSGGAGAYDLALTEVFDP